MHPTRDMLSVTTIGTVVLLLPSRSIYIYIKDIVYFHNILVHLMSTDNFFQHSMYQFKNRSLSHGQYGMSPRSLEDDATALCQAVAASKPLAKFRIGLKTLRVERIGLTVPRSQGWLFEIASSKNCKTCQPKSC